MCLRIRNAPASVVHSHYLVIEKDAGLALFQVAHVALESVKI
jgi:hypothetical protein